MLLMVQTQSTGMAMSSMAWTRVPSTQPWIARCVYTGAHAVLLVHMLAHATCCQSTCDVSIVSCLLRLCLQAFEASGPQDIELEACQGMLLNTTGPAFASTWTFSIKAAWQSIICCKRVSHGSSSIHVPRQ